MSWHYLRGQEAAFWEGCCSAGAPSALLRLIPSAGASCSPASVIVCSNRSQSGTTCRPSTGGRGEEASTLSRVASPVRTFPRRALRGTGSTEREAGSGSTCEGSLAKYDLATSSWRTPQLSLLEGLDEFSGIWPRWGSMRNGVCFAQAMPGFLTSASESGLLPTPTKSWARSGPGLSNNRDNLRMSAASTDLALAIVEVVGWRWPVSFIEWMMGWPTRWTALQPLETDRFQQWLLSRGRP